MEFQLLEQSVIKQVAGTYEELLEKLSGLDEECTLSVDCSAVMQIDTAFLQMLATLRERALQTGKNLHCQQPSEVFSRACCLLGLSNDLGLDDED